MRDPARIPEILLLVQSVWEKQPDQRLGQLLVNASRELPGWPDIFNVEDEVLTKRLEAWKAQLGG